MASETETVMAATTNPDPKPQKETTQDSDSQSSLTNTSSQSIASTICSNNTQLGYPSFSKLLEGVMAANSTLSSHPLAKDNHFQGQFGMSHQEALATVTAKAAQSQQLRDEATELSINLPQNKQPESSVLSSSSVLHEESPSLQSTDHIQKPSDKNSSDHASENRNSSPHKPLSIQLFEEKECKQGNTWLSKEQADDIPKTPNSDGYGWRKYGQKQVKNSGSSRSYYRCTFLNCSAKKKVQHLDGSGRIIAVVYKDDHNHDPPHRSKGSSGKRDASSTSEVNDQGDRAQKLDDPHALTSKCGKEVEPEQVPSNRESWDGSLHIVACISEGNDREEPISTSDSIQSLKIETKTLPSETVKSKFGKSNETVRSDPVKEYDVVPLKKRRIKERSKACSESVYRTFKEPKVVVHAAGDVESSSDGYRWRKYGQKMVKGNPNPRSYYRCSSAGCPVRKHVERAIDSSTAVIVTYEGSRHDHDKPAPKKCHGSPKSPAPVVETTTLVQKSEAKSPPAGQEPSPQGSRDKVTEAGSEKVLESARTLLSIGIELKSC